tara:strand:+ start:451 stop:633 length:183 start_codon:yes stop_codon:yes gene_type:complete
VNVNVDLRRVIAMPSVLDMTVNTIPRYATAMADVGLDVLATDCVIVVEGIKSTPPEKMCS